MSLSIERRTVASKARLQFHPCLAYPIIALADAQNVEPQKDIALVVNEVEVSFDFVQVSMAFGQ